MVNPGALEITFTLFIGATLFSIIEFFDCGIFLKGKQ